MVPRPPGVQGQPCAIAGDGPTFCPSALGKGLLFSFSSCRVWIVFILSRLMGLRLCLASIRVGPFIEFGKVRLRRGEALLKLVICQGTIPHAGAHMKICPTFT